MITLRAPEPEDLDCLYRWENDPAEWKSSLTPLPISRMKLWEYINEFDGNLDTWSQIRLIIVNSESEAVGTVDVYDLDRRMGRATVGIFVDANFRRRGYAREALEEIVRYAREILNLHQLVAIIGVDNVASLGLFKGAGFTSSGRLRSWIRSGRHFTDAIICQRLFP